MAAQQLFKSRLKVGQHVGRDFTVKEPVEIKDEDTGKVLKKRWATRTWSQGEVVESALDLAKKWPEKFGSLDEVPAGGPITQEEIERRGLVSAGQQLTMSEAKQETKRK